MLQKETIAAGTLELLIKLMQHEDLKDFFLVGGTALSLRIGHRKSIDIDLFSLKEFNEEKIAVILEKDFGFQVDFLGKNTLKGQINNIKIDLITHAYPFVKPLDNIEEIRIASLLDIAAMKLNAIVVNGTRLKDFIDIAFLSSSFSLDQMMQAYEIKYNKSNLILALKSLSFLDDINHDEPIQLVNGIYHWSPIVVRINKMLKSPAQLFDSMHNAFHLR